MSQRREIESRLELNEDLSGILGAMRSFALAELHRVTHRESAQQQVVETLTNTLQDTAPFLPPQPGGGDEIWLLFGSVRGFCGSFNEDVHRAWQAGRGAAHPTIVVGERLVYLMPKSERIYPLDGAEGGLDAATAIDRILGALARVGGKPRGLIACLRDEDGVRTQRLLPLPAAPGSPQPPPVMNEPAEKVALGVAEHFLFHMLLALQLRAIRVENRMRLMQMENALQHLERGSEDLQRQRNRMRQEEIVEEIELMARMRVGMG